MTINEFVDVLDRVIAKNEEIENSGVLLAETDYTQAEFVGWLKGLQFARALIDLDINELRTEE